ncbi:MAG: hypothetical protein HY062_12505 [Bacteroidetes bacterium]|nr:hypothetical protein [Bacteroidota bacterium]
MPNNSTQQSGQANLTDLDQAVKQTLIHVDLNRTYYGVSADELESIEEGATTIWKDVTFGGFGIGIPCIVNGIIEYNKVNTFNVEVFWNCLIGGISLAIAILGIFVWYKTVNKCKQLLENIRKRTPYKMS